MTNISSSNDMDYLRFQSITSYIEKNVYSRDPKKPLSGIFDGTSISPLEEYIRIFNMVYIKFFESDIDVSDASNIKYDYQRNNIISDYSTSNE